MWNMPEGQVKSMIDFVNKNIGEWEPLIFIWHSLWWHLAQIASSIYAKQLKNSYVYNAPWAQKLKYSIEQFPREYHDEIRKYTQYRDSDFLKNKVMNYDSHDTILRVWRRYMKKNTYW
jgi:hypothetical protein